MVVGWYRIIGLDYWIGLLDGFSSQTLTWPAARRGIPRRGVFFFYVIFSKIVINDPKWSTKVIYGPVFLKNCDILSDLII